MTRETITEAQRAEHRATLTRLARLFRPTLDGSCVRGLFVVLSAR